ILPLFFYFSSLSSPQLTIVAATVEIKKNSSFVFFIAKEMSNLSISTSSDANVFCRCGVNVELKISWTQLNTGCRFFCYKNTKRREEVDAIIFYGTMMKYRLKEKRSYG
ncbi:hypothetical protein H5410_054912, partial [Solanum commersonii]